MVQKYAYASIHIKLIAKSEVNNLGHIIDQREHAAALCKHLGTSTDYALIL